MEGADVGTAARAMIKYRSIFGAEVTIPQAKSRLLKVAQSADMDIESLAEYGPDAMAKAHAMGVSNTDFGAEAIVASQKLGGTRTTFTGLGEFFLKMPEASKKLGVELSRNLDVLDQLSKFKGDQLADAFGTEVGVAKALIEARDQVRKYKAELEAIGPTADDIGERLRHMWGDAGLNAAERSSQTEQILKNLPISKGYQQEWGAWNKRYEDAKIGAAQELGPALGWAAPVIAGANTAAESGAHKLGDLAKGAVGGVAKFFGYSIARSDRKVIDALIDHQVRVRGRKWNPTREEGEDIRRDYNAAGGRSDMPGGPSTQPAAGPGGSGSGGEWDTMAGAMNQAAEKIKSAAEMNQEVLDRLHGKSAQMKRDGNSQI